MERRMNVVFAMINNGGFVAGDRDSGMTSYAYPSSPHALVAKKYPKLVAEDMLGSERMSYRSVPAVKEYDLANWRKLRDAHPTGGDQ
jgi:hypothetical protein